MQLILFSKMLKDKSPEELVEVALANGLDGYDLCVRPDYPVNPDNAAEKLPEVARLMRQSGLDIGMVTGNFDLVAPDHPTAEPIVAAMDKADVRLLKLGYFHFDPFKTDYWAEVDRIRGLFEGWQQLGERYNVKICYHTHSNRCMGLNCAALAHLIRGFDPRYIGAYIDPCHMVIEGEEFPVGTAMIKDYLSIVSLKDAFLERVEKNGHGSKKAHVVPAGGGMVDWTVVFGELARLGYNGPLTIHCEFEVAPEQFMETLQAEAAFFRAQRDKLRAAG